MVRVILPFCHRFLSLCIQFLFRHLSSPYCRLVVSLVSKRRKKRHTYDFLFTICIYFCLLSSFSVVKYFIPFFIIHPCCRLVVNLVSKKHRKKKQLTYGIFHFSFMVHLFLPFCRPSCISFIYHHCCRLVVNLVSKIHIEKKKKTTYLSHFSFFIHSSCAWWNLHLEPWTVFYFEGKGFEKWGLLNILITTISNAPSEWLYEKTPHIPKSMLASSKFAEIVCHSYNVVVKNLKLKNNMTGRFWIYGNVKLERLSSVWIRWWMWW